MSDSTGYSVADCYNFIVSWALAHKGNTPSQRQIATSCGFSSATAYNCIKVLIKQGMLERVDGELCVVRSSFEVEPGAEQFILLTFDNGTKEAPSKINVFNMQYIPKDIQGISQKQLVKVGIGMQEMDDAHFWRAVYPKGWIYEVIDGETDRMLLIDSKGQYRALLHFHDGSATITFL